jgi:serine/threonine protein kinase
MPRDTEGDATFDASTTIDSGASTQIDTVQGPEHDEDATRSYATFVAEASPSRYRIKTLIGRGGIGEVFSAYDEQIGRSVAVKRLRVSQPTAEATARFLREARIQGRLEHPAVVPVHTMSHAREPFFVMKQLVGVTLAGVLQPSASAPAFTRQRLLRAFAEVCLAIEFAHTRGVVHRDLKPSNIMLGDFGEVYVLDWGIARIVGDDDGEFADIDTVDKVAAGTVIGTPGYMAPEQARGDNELDGRADVYALGCILFEILAGRPLHPRGIDGLASTLAGVDARPSVHAPERDVPPELDALCVAATALHRKDRVVSARALGDAVQRYLDGDRDLSLRRELAVHELAVAHHALAQGNTLDHRTSAIRAAARALALDPHARQPAELLGRLMLEPPVETPREVEHELATLDREAMRMQARVGSWALVSYLIFFPILYWAGLRDGWYQLLGLAGVAVAVTCVRLLSSFPTPTMLAVAVASNALLIAFFSRFLSPFLVAPSLGAVTAMWFAIHPRGGRIWALWIVILVGVLGPWVLELIGVLSPTTFIDGNRLVLVTHAAERMDPVLTLGAMALYTVALIAMVTVMSRSQASNQQATQRHLQTHVWQLRQLVPPAGPPP